MTNENISTGVAPITVATSSGENGIVVIPGANLKLTPEDQEKNRELFQKKKLESFEKKSKFLKKVEIFQKKLKFMKKKLESFEKVEIFEESWNL